MKKIEAKTLEEAYEKAAKEFDCSVTDLEYEIVQHPSSGFLGIGIKKAVIVATCKSKTPEQLETRTIQATQADDDRVQTTPKHPEEMPERESQKNGEKYAQTKRTHPATSEEKILDGFFDRSNGNSRKRSVPTQKTKKIKPSTDEKELGNEIEKELKILMESTCFDIDVVEVDVIDGTAYIFIDGEDAALLIGKEGYRYNALSYLLYNWIHNLYGLFIKLEIAQFLASQQEMIRNYIQPVVDHVYHEGWGKTRPLDGILVQIALEQLREEFPQKYVAIKRTRDGQRYILINEFNKRS